MIYSSCHKHKIDLLFNTLRVDLQLSGIRAVLAARRAYRLVDHDARVWRGGAISGGTAREQNCRHRRARAVADRVDRAVD